MKRVKLLSVRGEDVEERTDAVAIEEPVEIRASGPGQEAVRVAVTMRTPGHDTELAIGFLFTEGLFDGPEDLADPKVEEPEIRVNKQNKVTVRLKRRFDAERFSRNFYATSSCGICGKAAIEQVEIASQPVAKGPVVGAALIRSLPAKMRAAQAGFEGTGGMHATGLFDTKGTLLVVREDVGRHNAMDKAIGTLVLRGEVPGTSTLAMVSGRASFELVQKAAMAGIPILCAVSAPTSLAIELAEKLKMTLIGFLRGETMNVYTGEDRVK